MLLLLAACASGLAPSQRFAGDDAVGELPADTVLVVGGDPGKLADARVDALLETLAGKSAAKVKDALASPAAEAARGLDAARLGVGPTGAVAVASGDVGALRPRWEERPLLRSPRGVETSWNAGTLRVAEPSARDARGFDPAMLDGVVPAGDVWAATVDPVGLVSVAAERLDEGGSAAGRALALPAAVGRLFGDTAGVRSVAASVAAGDAVRLRIACHDAPTASALRAAGPGWLAAVRLPDVYDRGRARWAVSGTVVEVTVPER